MKGFRSHHPPSLDFSWRREVLVPVLCGTRNVLMTEPLSYGTFARLLQRATIVLTDSGGVQEEAPEPGETGAL